MKVEKDDKDHLRTIPVGSLVISNNTTLYHMANWPKEGDEPSNDGGVAVSGGGAGGEVDGGVATGDGLGDVVVGPGEVAVGPPREGAGGVAEGTEDVPRDGEVGDGAGGKKLGGFGFEHSKSKREIFGYYRLFHRSVIPSILPLSHGRTLHQEFRVRAVNLGGWLVAEGWMKPSLFDGIPNKDFLDGTGLQFKSVTTRKYLCAESGGGTIIVANCTSTSGWETFSLWRLNEDTFRFRVFNKQFVGLDGVNIVAVSNISTDSLTFNVVKESGNSSRVRIKASNGYFLQAKTEGLVTADVSEVKGWGDDDPTIFVMTIAAKLQGEFQVTNGYGPKKAPQIMKEHWRTFIVEDDFEFLVSHGLNAVRIPIGWWIASDPTPPPPYVGGSLNALDNAFLWAEKYGLKIFLDLHAAPGSQNGFENSSPRDGSIEWGKTDENIDQTVQVIDFLTARYAKSPRLYAVELLNEPLAPGVTVEMLNKYYKLGYEAVRKHSLTAYVVLSNRLGPSQPKELFPLANGLA
ncbi:hypothetical protein Fmac_031595 [Flemingia macrophylla]|uniref:Mannan endo-1,4-beta-mannosidase n=1 Tax=Flemingia macrophylla TaxID=520843 RepID=A0ABD1L2H8_9FABA